MRPLPGSRPGYALLWTVATIAVVATLFAAAAPTVVTAIDRAKVAETYDILHDIDSGIVRFGTTVKRVGTVYPLKVHDLSTLVTVGSRISCGANAYTNNSVTTWTANGPFVGFFADPSGVSTPMGDVNDSLEHAASNAPLYIRLPNADADLVVMLDEMVDNGDLGASGKVLYAAPVNGVTDVEFRVGTPPAFTLVNQC